MPNQQTTNKDESSILRRPGWQRNLVSSDFSRTALRALEVAVPLAHDHGARGRFSSR